MKNIIKFYPSTQEIEGVIDSPIPSIKLLPKWYKDMLPYVEKNKLPRMVDHQLNKTVKTCVPVFDALTSGYIITLEGDVIFNPSGYRYEYAWSVDYTLIENHNEKQSFGMPVPENFSNTPLKWINNWIIKTPPGYSCMVVHPFGYNDLPFITIPGIVDTDTYPAAINFPFFIKKNFVGVIPSGTPIAQIIPIKREDWKSKIEKFDLKIQKEKNKLFRYLEKGYRKYCWNKKKYE